MNLAKEEEGLGEQDEEGRGVLYVCVCVCVLGGGRAVYLVSTGKLPPLRTAKKSAAE